MNRFRLSLAVALWAVLAAASRATPVAVANRSLANEKLDPAKLKAVFLGRRVSWAVGGRVVLAILPDGALADAFLGKATGMDAASFRNYWRRLAMTGGGLPPKTFSSDADLVAFVARTPGAIGFADDADAGSSVVVVRLP